MTSQTADQKNVGHGHVYPRPDGVKARCGGPALCSECARDAARKAVEESGELLAAVMPTAGHEDEPPITFDALSYALFSVDDNAVLTTAHGNLAIFSTKGMAELWAKSSRKNIKVIAVQIQQASRQ